ncbi:MAG TPA: methionyl-tRNA formyltransferase [Bavariicoccus seileri]|uniref:Methionyl-tRNA formyltransferase n=1 Tax=Bavariicoccus seileri TaxID=549685 RepID=A0A3D4S4P5_9ENTE|nr:methionyl-tRNA formyltransferase [Bavariicoccus seileri]HCS93452.1 methionyl-tRNA formyltransferase [Bavariicoccus seileri]
MKRIIFMGTPAFSAPILETLVSQFDVVAAVTQPDRPVGRKRLLTPSPVKKVALKHGIDVYQPEKITQSTELEQLMALKADVIVTAAFGQFLPSKLLKTPTFGAVNVHASLLPEYRGGAPVHYAIWQGKKETGITFMRMVKEMDAGNILKQYRIPILPTDDVGSMFDKLSQLACLKITGFLEDLFAGNITEIKQDERYISYSPTIKKEEERIDWTGSAQEIDQKIRAFRPFPGTYTFLDGQRFKIWEASPLSVEQTRLALGNDAKTDVGPGTFVKLSSTGWLVLCGRNTSLELKQVQPAGKGKMSVADYLNGHGKKWQTGDRFDETNE